MATNQEQVQNLIKTFQKSENERRRWEPLHRDISDLVAPTRHLDSQTDQFKQERGRFTYDDTAPESSSRLAASLFGLMTSPSLQWFSLSNQGDRDDRDSEIWIDLAEEKLLGIFNSPSTGFKTAIHESFQDLVTFGTCAMMVDDDERINYTTRPLFEIYPVQNDKFQIDKVYRKFWFTAYQAASRFGAANLSDDAFKDWESGDRHTRKRCYIQAIVPRDDRDVSSLFSENMPIASIFIDLEAEKMVGEGGFEEMPLMVARWMRGPGETFGRSPASVIIDEIRLANKIKKSLVKGIEKQVDPSLLIPDSSMISPVRLNPGGLNYVRPGMSDQIKTIPTGDPRSALELLQDTRAFIRSTFFMDIIDLPLLDRMTATEVIQRRQDKLQIVAPFISRIEEELLTPVIGRTLKIAIRRGELPEPPENLLGSGMEVEYVSPLSISQRTGKVQAWQIFQNTVTPMLQADPELLEQLDTDEIFRDLGYALNVPESYFRPKEEAQQRIDQKRQTRQIAEEAAAGQQVAEAARSGAEAISTLGLVG